MDRVRRLAALATLAAALALPATAQAKLRCSYAGDRSPTVGDIDGDFGADPVLGLPGRHGGRGAVFVSLAKRTQLLTLKDFPGLGAPHRGDGFGAAVAIGDVDADGCADLIVGAPGRDAAYLLHGGRKGIRGDGATRLALPAAPGDEVGAAVALSQRPATRQTELWVGAPGHGVGGAVLHVHLDRAGTPGAVETIAEGTPTVPHAARHGERFGAVLAAARYGALAGVPRADGGRGLVVRLRLDHATGASLPAQLITATTRRRGDRFGAAVTADVDGTGGAIGAPGTDVRGHRDAGALIRLAEAKGDTLARRRVYVQGERDVRGTPEAGDRFGASVAYGRGVQCQEAGGIAAGAPGEDVGGAADAGDVTIVSFADFGCKPRLLWAGHGLPGVRRRGDALGSAVALLRFRDDFDEDTYDAILASAPGRGLVYGRQGGFGAAGAVLPVPARAGDRLVPALTEAGFTF